MKLLMENWQYFLEEEKFSLLLEQELNEATVADIKKWFSNKLRKGATKEDLETMVDEKVPDPDRRKFLKGLLGTAAVAAVGGIPAIAKGNPTEPTSEMIRLFKKGIDNAIGIYFPGKDAGNKIIRLLVKKMQTMRPEAGFNFKNISEQYPKLYNLFIETLNAVQPKAEPLKDNVMAFVQARKDNNKPLAMVFNSSVDWETDRGFAQQMGFVTREAGLSHEMEHLVEYSWAYITRFLEEYALSLSDDAYQELRAIFDIDSLSHGHWHPEEELNPEEWSGSIEEIYADFKALRTRLHRSIEKEDLDNLCQQRCKKADANPSENYLHNHILAKLKCTPNCLFDNSENGVEAANKFAIKTQNKSDDGAIV